MFGNDSQSFRRCVCVSQNNEILIGAPTVRLALLLDYLLCTWFGGKSLPFEETSLTKPIFNWKQCAMAIGAGEGERRQCLESVVVETPMLTVCECAYLIFTFYVLYAW